MLTTIPRRDYRDLTIEHLLEAEHDQQLRIEHLELERETVLVWFKAALHQLAALTTIVRRRNETIARLRAASRDHSADDAPTTTPPAWSRPNAGPRSQDNHLPC